ncbi:uncharacterized protein LOC111023190 [Momordica charantia]|uniref:Uncharacterized protein LOC111023190 n=1 Tax=Momordica charantia TaxID=3673 RepID=A0A6J1DUE1_MOMCH|nr:uncharacterized protein LOC111023190 [Momordica charantia]
MDFARCSDESKESEHPSSKCCSKVEAQPEVVELRGPGAAMAAPLGPATPDADRESGDFPSDSKSPHTQVVPNRSLQLTCLDSLGERSEAPLEEGLESSDPLCSPRTPKDGVFDPFSPGPAHLALAPLSRKYFSGSVGFVARRLQFGSSSSSSSMQLEEEAEEQSISDSELLEAVYENLLEVIVSNQAEASLAQLSSSQSDSSNCITPPAQYLSGIAQTCPPAPIKPLGKFRDFDLGLCRKLEF